MGDKPDGIVGDENWGKLEKENTDLDIQANTKQKKLQQLLSFGGLFDSIYLTTSHRIEVKRLVELAGLTPLSVQSFHQQSWYTVPLLRQRPNQIEASHLLYQIVPSFS